MATVLVVDDSPIDRQLAGGLLQQGTEWTVTYANDGSAALDSIRSNPPDIIVADLQMPEMSGLELVQAVRKSASQIPIILMTGKGTEEIAVEALHSGAASYVPKRAMSTMLVETVQRVLTSFQEDKYRSDLMKRVVVRSESFGIENDVNLLLSLSRHIQQSLVDAWGMDRTDRLRIGTALEEALLNSLYHGNLGVSSELKEVDHDEFYRRAAERKITAPWKDRRIRVTTRVTLSEMSVTISDEGSGFDPSKLPDPTDPENLDRPCGRGVMLMRAFMDDVRYNDVGNEVTLVRRRNRKS
ncbi:MAG: response regulator [Planctomycetes bacterium]|nr:response regulator [Planctomycetota bacterium]